MRKQLGVAVVLAAAIAVTGLVRGQAKTDPALNKIAAEFEAAYNAKDAAKVASMYADDAVVMPPNAPMVKGRANIEARLKSDMAEGAKLQLKPIESSISGDMAFEAGSVVITMGSGSTENEKYLTVFKRVGKDWKIAYDIFN